MPDAQPSSVTIDQKGSIKVTLNLVAKLVVEKSPGKWVDGRRIYATL